MVQVSNGKKVSEIDPRKNKMHFYETFADQFDEKMNDYDTLRRLEVVFDQMLTEDLTGKSFLDAGCGTGHFSKMAVARGAFVTSMDVGPNLLAQVAKKCNSKRIIGNILKMDFADNSFDYVLSTEVIEHTESPETAISELIRVTKPGGICIITVPNKVWYFAIYIANKFKLRPYEGYENWISWRQLKNLIRCNGGILLDIRGIHLFPFIFNFTTGILRYLDRFGRLMGPIMLNIAVKITK